MKKELKIFNYPWHISHQYSLMQIPNTKWSWLTQPRRSYGHKPRGAFFEKMGGEWVPNYEKDKYDLALLHLDQQCVEETLWERGKGSLYKELNELITDIPKIVIMHGTPYYPEKFETKELIKIVKKAVGDTPMVVNSYEAGQQWAGNIDFDKKDKEGKPVMLKYDGIDPKQIYPIWHGLDPDDWKDLPKEPRVITMISPGGLDKYYDRNFLNAVRERLIDRDITHAWITVDVGFNNFEEYRDFVGRSLIYFNPTKESPMPRSRTEAMLSGCCVVTTPHQDADMFIKNGVNGYIVPRNPDYTARLIEGLIRNYKEAIDVGQKGKKTAMIAFDKDRYEQQWTQLIHSTIQNYGKK